MAEAVLDRQTLKAGESIFREGAEANSAFIVQSGQIDIYKAVGDNEIVLGSVGQGGIFGEMALVDDAPRMASARAAEPTTVIVVTRQMFEQKLAKTDPFIRGLLNIFVGNIRAMSKPAAAPAPAPAPAPTEEAGE